MTLGDSMRVRLSPDEVAERAQQLAHAVRGLVVLEEEQREERQAMTAALKAARKHVRDLADVVRTGVEDRPSQLRFFDEAGRPPEDRAP